MSKENKPDEKELWKKLLSTQGADRAEAYVELSQLALDHRDHTTSLALCQSAHEIYEGHTDFVGTAPVLNAYEGITWSLRGLDRDAEAAEVALDVAKIVKEEDQLLHLKCFEITALHCLCAR